MDIHQSIYIGFDHRETAAYAVCRTSIRLHNRHLPTFPLILDEMEKRELYVRPTERRFGRCYDAISKTESYDGQMSTEFAITRFLTPYLARTGQALFMDCDMLVRANLSEIFELALKHPEYAVMCVKHNHQPANKEKMDGAAQTNYSRKNWSSFMLFNCDHPSNRALNLDLVNGVPGRDLHRFCWLADEEIGDLGPEWNYLVGHTELPADVEPKVLHFTDGTPDMAAYRDVEYADEWRSRLHRWAA